MVGIRDGLRPCGSGALVARDLQIRADKMRNHGRAKLWGSLCHQHAYISSAALPAAPFIIAVLGRQQAPVVEEALDIMLGFIRCTVPSMVDAPPWHSELRTIVLSAGPSVRRLAAGADPSVADMARMLLFEAGIVAT
jgi:hypothetical protein